MNATATFSTAASLCRQEARRQVGKIREMRAKRDFREFPEALSSLKRQRSAASHYTAMSRTTADSKSKGENV